ncbi:FadR/GntR family transcriptional regulator [Streptomyces shenzhenensis]|uniref:FadR/GntR family transcriptional regulator n=1 Tax=Streptomyces shenzhenensis TaxID=943815 RepID=UPI0033C50DF2
MNGYNGRGVHGHTVTELGMRIVSGALPQGQPIDLQALGEDLDLSMTALREALKVLTAKGLLEARQRRGTLVLPRERWNLLDADVIRWRNEAGETLEVLRDLAEVRAAIEPEAASLAALRRTEAELAELDAALDAMREAVGREAPEAVAADLRFHRTLLRATHNEMFARMDVFIEPALRLRDGLVHQHGRHEDPVPSHARVVDAVRAGDAEAAANAARALLAKATEDAERLLEASGEKRVVDRG